MSGDLHAIAYISKSRIDGDIAEHLTKLVEKASARNREDELTGALICSPRYFAQIIEGPEENLEETFERIQMDNRHFDVKVLYMTPIAQRSFGRWGMASAGVMNDDTTIQNALEMLSSDARAEDAEENGTMAMAKLSQMLLERELK